MTAKYARLKKDTRFVYSDYSNGLVSYTTIIVPADTIVEAIAWRPSPRKNGYYYLVAKRTDTTIMQTSVKVFGNKRDTLLEFLS